MTLEEALARIQAVGRCFVIFDANTGEVLEIEAQGGEPAEELIGAMKPAATRHGAVMGRFLDGATVTRRDLEDVESDARTSARRTAWFNLHAPRPPEELLGALEREDFAEPLDLSSCAEFLIERLFDYPPADLHPLVPRLERVCGARLKGRLTRLLESRLAVLARDYARLKAIWQRFDRTTFTQLVWHPELLTCLGDLRPREPEPIELLIQTVGTSRNLMFGPRREAMRPYPVRGLLMAVAIPVRGVLMAVAIPVRGLLMAIPRLGLFNIPRPGVVDGRKPDSESRSVAG
ncbi:MAG: hypothetical protein R3B48_23530 [Kofleriaceae bacterium]